MTPCKLCGSTIEHTGERDATIYDAHFWCVDAERVASEPTMPTASWVLRNKATGEVIEVIAETFLRHVAEAINTEKYEAVPIQRHLAELNREIRLYGHCLNCGDTSPMAMGKRCPNCGH